MKVNMSPSQREINSMLIKVAAMCHREKWQFDVEEYTRSHTASNAFDILHKAGDQLMKLVKE